MFFVTPDGDTVPGTASHFASHVGYRPDGFRFDKFAVATLGMIGVVIDSGHGARVRLSPDLLTPESADRLMSVMATAEITRLVVTLVGPGHAFEYNRQISVSQLRPLLEACQTGAPLIDRPVYDESIAPGLLPAALADIAHKHEDIKGKATPEFMSMLMGSKHADRLVVIGEDSRVRYRGNALGIDVGSDRWMDRGQRLRESATSKALIDLRGPKIERAAQTGEKLFHRVRGILPNGCGLGYAVGAFPLDLSSGRRMMVTVSVPDSISV